MRYDGGHKRDAFVADTLGALVKFVPVCPEMEIGLGTPREPIELSGEGDELRLVGTQSGRDLTATMRTYAKRRVDELIRLDLSGYVLKSGSPSCDMEHGLFAAELATRLPLLPIEDEKRLQDPNVRESFIQRVLSYARSK